MNLGVQVHAFNITFRKGEDGKIWKNAIFKSHSIHGAGIFTYIYHKNQLNVGTYASPSYMDAMGMGVSRRLKWLFSLKFFTPWCSESP